MLLQIHKPDSFCFLFLSYSWVLPAAQDHQLWGGKGLRPHQWAHAAPQGWSEPRGSFHGQNEYVRGKRHGRQQQHPVMCCLGLRKPCHCCAVQQDFCLNRKIRASELRNKTGPQVEHEICGKSKNRWKKVFYFMMARHCTAGGLGGRKGSQEPTGYSLTAKNVWLSVVSDCRPFLNSTMDWIVGGFCCFESWHTCAPPSQGLTEDILAVSMPQIHHLTVL